MKNTIRFFLFIQGFFFLASVPAFSATDSNPICELKAPDDEHVGVPDRGLNLGGIITQNVFANSLYRSSLEPTLQLDFDYGAEITNLTKGPANQERELVFAPSQKGYRVLDYAMIEAGVGAQLAFFFGNAASLLPGAWASVGILPVIGKNLVAMRNYDSKSALDNRERLIRLDTSLSTVESLQNRDALSYTSKGGLVFWAGAGYSLVNFTVAGLAQGEFQIYLEKVDKDHVFVKITDSQLTSLGIQAGATLASVGVAEFSKYASGLSFLINFHDQLGAKAFTDLIYGNAAPVQKLAAGKKIEAVQFFDEFHLSRTGSSSFARLGIPLILRFNWSKDRYFEKNSTSFYSCNRKLQNSLGAYYSRNESGSLSVSERFTKAFYGNSFSLLNSKKNSRIAGGFFGQLVWNYKGNKVDPDTFRRALERIGAETGLRDQLIVGVPQSRVDSLDFVSISLRAQFSARNARNLVRNARGYGREALVALARKMAQDHMNSSENSALICIADKERKEPSLIEPAACVFGVTGNTDSAMNSMYNSLISMDAALQGGDENAAAKAYARFGEAMLTNRFTFQVGLQLAGADLKLDYSVEGSDFYSFHRFFKTGDESGRLISDRRPPIKDPRKEGQSGIRNEY